MSDDPLPPFGDDAPIEEVILPATPPVTPPVAPLVEVPKPKRQGNYVNAKYKLPELTAEQKAFVESHWFIPDWDLKRITQEVGQDKRLNGHHALGKAVRAHIATLGKPGELPPKAKTTQIPKKGRVELTEPQQASVTQMLNQENPPATKEIFKLVFPDLASYSHLCGEYQALIRFVRETNEEAIDLWDEPVTERRYKPPGSYSILIGMVNRYVGNAFDPSRALYDNSKMKTGDERNIKALLSYMKTTKFVLQASQYDRRVDRELFESTFVRHVQDKASDLTPEEVDTYISIAADTVKEARIGRQIIKEENLINECLDGEDDNGNKAKLSMSLVESVKSLRTERKEVGAHVHKLITSVSGSRAKRVENKVGKNDHVGNWIALWVNEQSRKDLIELGRLEHAEDATEYGRIKSVDDSWALIAGQTEEEATKAP